MSSEPRTSTTQIALLVDSTCLSASPWWKSFMKGFSDYPYLQVVAVWAEDQSTARQINNVFFNDSCQEYVGWPEATPAKTKKALDGLSNVDNNIDGLIIDLPPMKHTRALEVFFSIQGFNKHVFSSSIPTFNPNTLIKLLHQQIGLQQSSITKHIQQYNSPVPIQSSIGSVWTIADPMKFEYAISLACDMLPDIGNVLGGSLIGTQLPCMMVRGYHSIPDKELDNPSDFLINEILTIYSALLRRIFGEPLSTSAIKSRANPKDASSLTIISGSIKFINGALVSINISDRVSPFLVCWIWGSSGRLSISWDLAKQYFVVQRYLKHFEHPSLYHPTGASTCLRAWIESIQYPTHVPPSFNLLVDVTLADAILTSDSSLVAFKVIPVVSPRIVNTHSSIDSNVTQICG